MSNGKKPAKAGDESYAVLQSLIAKGRKEGMLRASELNAELEKLDISPEKIEEIYEKFDMRGAGVETTVGSMSGGNMQKVVIAREFSFDTPVLVIAQPTRGVDVGAIEFIHSRIIEKRNAGCAILLCSADLDEVFRLSDRIITMYEGRITGEFCTSDITKEDIGRYMTGHRDGKEPAKT